MISSLQWMQQFAEEVKYYLKENHMTQRDLADKAGLAESSISEYLNSTSIPSTTAVINIAYALDVEVNELIDFGSRIV